MLGPTMKETDEINKFWDTFENVMHLFVFYFENNHIWKQLMVKLGVLVVRTCSFVFMMFHEGIKMHFSASVYFRSLNADPYYITCGCSCFEVSFTVKINHA